jgi:hypothetical protein
VAPASTGHSTSSGCRWQEPERGADGGQGLAADVVPSTADTRTCGSVAMQPLALDTLPASTDLARELVRASTRTVDLGRG